MTVAYYVGLDVSMETTAICVLAGDGKVLCEASVASDACDIAAMLKPYAATIEAVGLEAGPMSEWLVRGLQDHGLQSVLMETRRVHAALSAIPVKTDRKDARGIAELLRMGWYQPVHMKTPRSRDLRLLLSARESLGRRMRDLDNSIRGLLRGFGLRLPTGLRGRIGMWARDLIQDNPMLTMAIEPLLVAREALAGQLSHLDKRLRSHACHDRICRRLMTVPGVGAIVAMTYRTAIDDPARFRSSKSVAACFGLTPRRYQSGETDRYGCITKAGDGSVRAALFEAVHVMMVRTIRWTPLKAWAMRLAARRGAKRAKVALARKLAVIMHRMWVDGTEFRAAA
jgi:transposase